MRFCRLSRTNEHTNTCQNSQNHLIGHKTCPKNHFLVCWHRRTYTDTLKTIPTFTVAAGKIQKTSWKCRPMFTMIGSMFVLSHYNFLCEGLPGGQHTGRPISFTQWSENEFFAPQERHVIQINVKFDMGVRQTEYSHQNCQNLEFCPQLFPKGESFARFLWNS